MPRHRRRSRDLAAVLVLTLVVVIGGAWWTIDEPQEAADSKVGAVVGFEDQ